MKDCRPGSLAVHTTADGSRWHATWTKTLEKTRHPNTGSCQQKFHGKEQITMAITIDAANQGFVAIKADSRGDSDLGGDNGSDRTEKPEK